MDRNTLVAWAAGTYLAHSEEESVALLRLFVEMFGHPPPLEIDDPIQAVVPRRIGGGQQLCLGCGCPYVPGVFSLGFCPECG